MTDSKSEINFSLSLKHCKELRVDRTSGSRSSTVGITDVFTQTHNKQYISDALVKDLMKGWNLPE